MKDKIEKWNWNDEVKFRKQLDHCLVSWTLNSNPYWLEDKIMELLKAQRQDLKKKVEGKRFDTEGTLLDVYQERFEDGYNRAIQDVLKLLEEDEK